jgi:cysteine-rich repeat protein
VHGQAGAEKVHIRALCAGGLARRRALCLRELMRRAAWPVMLGALVGAACFVDVPMEATGTTTTGQGTTSMSQGSGEETSGTTAMTGGAVCGDGIVQGGELCDSGGLEGGVCTPWCTLNACGDGYLGPGEACDDENTADFDGCSAACTLEICGDAIVQPWENCDDGNTIAGDGCSESCALEGCGNGSVERGEECDDGNTDDDDRCTSLCRAPVCGDGIVTPSIGEACDDGPANGDNAACTASCKVNVCGDGLVGPDEGCDDGNVVALDGCSSSCVRDARFVFVTSTRYVGMMGGLTGADQRCQERAAAAGLPGTYLAWLADSTGSPILRFPASTMPYIRAGDHAIVASSLQDLLDGQIDATISNDEFGAAIAFEPGKVCENLYLVWTNVDVAGARRSNADCQDWKMLDLGRTGSLVATGSAWTDSGCPNRLCSTDLRLYCFEIEG